MSQTRKRPWLAAALSLFYPGAGHLYLRQWARAALWFGLFLASSYLLVPPSATPDGFSIEALMEASRQIPTTATLAIMGLSILSMLDAYMLATRHNESVERARKRIATANSDAETATESEVDTSVNARCPSCGHDLDDPEIGFCPWCAEKLDGEETDRSRTPW